MNGVESSKGWAANRGGEGRELSIELDEGEPPKDGHRVRGGVHALNGLAHFHDGDASARPSGASDAGLQGGGFRLGDDELRKRRGVEIQEAHRSSARRSARSASVAVRGHRHGSACDAL